MKFEDLKLIPSILKALRDKNYTEPTSIQAKSIPLILNREDVLGSAQTGTGKQQLLLFLSFSIFQMSSKMKMVKEKF
jgi:superfamily II DNA/RNA helicase